MDPSRRFPNPPARPQPGFMPSVDSSPPASTRAQPLSEAEDIKRSYRLSQSATADGGPASGNYEYMDPFSAARPSTVLEPSPSIDDYAGGHIVPEPYDEHVPGVLHRRVSSPSIGPWDSASQRYVPTSLVPLSSTSHPHPLPPLPVPPASLALTPQSHSCPMATPRHVHAKSSMGGLSYIDETGEYYSSPSKRPASQPLAEDDKIELRALIGGAEGMAGRGSGPGASRPASRLYQEYDPPPFLYEGLQQEGKTRQTEARRSVVRDWLLFPTGLDRLLALFGKRWGEEPLQQRIERKRRRGGGQRWPVAAWSMAAGTLSFPPLRYLG